MNTNHEQELADRIDRELKALPLLSAPSGLARRVMTRLSAQEEVAWYHRAWPTWPLAWRTASLIVLLGLFGGMCFAGWRASDLAGMSAATEQVGGALALVSLVGKVLSTLGHTATQVVRHLGTGFIIALVTVVALGYATFVALGSYYLRFAFARR